MDEDLNENLYEEMDDYKVKFFKYNIRALNENEMKEQADYFIEDAKKKGLIELGSSWSSTSFNIALLSGIILLILFIAMFPGRGHSEGWIAPIWAWISVISVFVISSLICKGYSKNTILDLKRNKLAIEHRFFSISKIVDITDFKDIKLIGISTGVTLKEETDRNKKTIKKLNWQIEIILFYGDNNKKLTINTLDYISDYKFLKTFEEIENVTIYAVTYFLKCKFIYGDFSSKIVVKKDEYNKDLERLIEFVPIEQQLPGVDFKIYDSTYTVDKDVVPSKIVSFKDSDL